MYVRGAQVLYADEVLGTGVRLLLVMLLSLLCIVRSWPDKLDKYYNIDTYIHT